MPSTAELICIDPKRIHEFWPHIENLLRSAIIRTGLSAFRDVEYDILYGDALVWIAWRNGVDAVASTSLVETDAGKVCIITACAGSDMKQWLPLIEKIEAYAKNEGCKCVRIYGRKGWMRVLQGYREKHVIMDKELS